MTSILQNLARVGEGGAVRGTVVVRHANGSMTHTSLSSSPPPPPLHAAIHSSSSSSSFSGGASRRVQLWSSLTRGINALTPRLPAFPFLRITFPFPRRHRHSSASAPPPAHIACHGEDDAPQHADAADAADAARVLGGLHAVLRAGIELSLSKGTLRVAREDA